MLLSTLIYLALLVNLSAAPESSRTLGFQADPTCPGQEGVALIAYTSGGTSVELSYDGKITFTDDERDIKSISPGGFFRYSRTTFGNRREIYIQSNAEGLLTRRYFVGRTEEPYVPEGHKWLQEMLPEIIATSGIGAEDRIRRIYARAGTKGVLNQIEALENDYTKSIYYGYLFNQPTLKEADLRLTLTHLNEELDSDYEKSKLLRKISTSYLQNEKVTQAYLAAVSNIASDYEKARVLTYVLQNGKLSPGNFTVIIPATARISSDYEQAKVLRTVLVNPAVTPQVHKEVIRQLHTLDSDYEKNRVLVQLLNNPKCVSSNFEEMMQAISRIDSDYEKARALNYLFTKQKLTVPNYLQVFPVISSINSNHDKSRTLQKVKTIMPADNAQVRAAYIRTAKSIDSEYEYRKVINGLE